MAAADDWGDALLVGGVNSAGGVALDGLAGAIGTGFGGIESQIVAGGGVDAADVYRVLHVRDWSDFGFERGFTSGNGARLGFDLGRTSALDVAERAELRGGV